MKCKLLKKILMGPESAKYIFMVSFCRHTLTCDVLEIALENDNDKFLAKGSWGTCRRRANTAAVNVQKSWQGEGAHVEVLQYLLFQRTFHVSDKVIGFFHTSLNFAREEPVDSCHWQQSLKNGGWLPVLPYILEERLIFCLKGEHSYFIHQAPFGLYSYLLRRNKDPQDLYYEEFLLWFVKWGGSVS